MKKILFAFLLAISIIPASFGAGEKMTITGTLCSKIDNYGTCTKFTEFVKITYKPNNGERQEENNTSNGTFSFDVHNGRGTIDFVAMKNGNPDPQYNPTQKTTDDFKNKSINVLITEADPKSSHTCTVPEGEGTNVVCNTQTFNINKEDYYLIRGTVVDKNYHYKKITCKINVSSDEKEFIFQTSSTGSFYVYVPKKLTKLKITFIPGVNHKEYKPYTLEEKDIKKYPSNGKYIEMEKEGSQSEKTKEQAADKSTEQTGQTDDKVSADCEKDPNCSGGGHGGGSRGDDNVSAENTANQNEGADISAKKQNTNANKNGSSTGASTGSSTGATATQTSSSSGSSTGKSNDATNASLNSVTGKILLEGGTPAQNATIRPNNFEGQTNLKRNYDLADEDGNFTISNFPKGYDAIVEYIGYATQIISASELGQNMEITLLSNTLLLNPSQSQDCTDEQLRTQDIHAVSGAWMPEYKNLETKEVETPYCHITRCEDEGKYFEAYADSDKRESSCLVLDCKHDGEILRGEPGTIYAKCEYVVGTVCTDELSDLFDCGVLSGIYEINGKTLVCRPNVCLGENGCDEIVKWDRKSKQYVCKDNSEADKDSAKSDGDTGKPKSDKTTPNAKTEKTTEPKCECGYNVQPDGSCKKWAENEECTADSLPKNATRGTKACDANKKPYCKIADDGCADDFHPSDDNKSCVSNKNTDCLGSLGTGSHAYAAEWQSGDNGKLICVITKCNHGYGEPVKNKDYAKPIDGRCDPQKSLSDEDYAKQQEQLAANTKKMKDKENSLVSKTIDAVGIGATGIGGMMLASGISETANDAAAENEIRGYLASYRCDYGTGQQYVGGETGIELPGGTDMFNLNTKYINRARELKEMKEALGMKPGIESEVIVNNAESGLYDDESTGITGGHFASIARALSNPDGDDATQLAADRKSATTKLTAGAITAGVGAVGSLAANLIVNSGDDNRDKSSEILSNFENKKTAPNSSKSSGSGKDLSAAAAKLLNGGGALGLSSDADALNQHEDDAPENFSGDDSSVRTPATGTPNAVEIDDDDTTESGIKNYMKKNYNITLPDTDASGIASFFYECREIDEKAKLMIVPPVNENFDYTSFECHFDEPHKCKNDTVDNLFKKILCKDGIYIIAITNMCDENYVYMGYNTGTKNNISIATDNVKKYYCDNSGSSKSAVSQYKAMYISYRKDVDQELINRGRDKYHWVFDNKYNSNGRSFDRLKNYTNDYITETIKTDLSNENENEKIIQSFAQRSEEQYKEVELDTLSNLYSTSKMADIPVLAYMELIYPTATDSTRDFCDNLNKSICNTNLNCEITDITKNLSGNKKYGCSLVLK